MQEELPLFMFNNNNNNNNNNNKDSQCLRGKYLEKFLDQLKKIMVTGE